MSPSSSSSKRSHPDGLVLLVPTRGWKSDPFGPEAELPGVSDQVAKNELGGKGFGILGCTKPTGGKELSVNTYKLVKIKLWTPLNIWMQYMPVLFLVEV